VHVETPRPGCSHAFARGAGLGDDPDGLDRFADIVLDTAVGTVGLVKPQSAFFERHGRRGFRTLSQLIADARAGLLPAHRAIMFGDRELDA
jgi:hypothetical protein